MRKLLLFNFIVLAMMANTIFAQEKKQDKLKLYGDVRFRTELDRDSRKTDGSYRADRDRFRFRFRFGFKYALNENIEFGGRLRSGDPMNPQSPHVTLGSAFTTKSVSIDKAYIKYHKNGFYIWAGKNGMNMWEPDEMFWDADVTPEGIAMGKTFAAGENSKLNLSTGYFVVLNTIEDNAQTFGKNVHATFFQLKYCANLGDNKLILAPAIVSSNTEKVLGYDYNIFVAFAQFKTSSGLNFNIDYFNNMADLEGKVDPNFEDQTTGFSATVGYAFSDKLSAKLSYASIEKYSVIDRFAQDDWVRWDTTDPFGITYTRSSNFSGFGLAFKYNISKNFDTQLKFWDVEGLVRATTDTALETGTRIRWDFNIKF